MKFKLLVVLFLMTTMVFQAQKKEKQKIQNEGSSTAKKWQLPPLNDSQLLTVEDQRLFLATDKEMQWFKDAKFGIFIHWGPALLVTNTLSWGRFGERPAAGKPAKGGIDPKIYDNAYKKFDPVNFDAEKWVKQMKSWGATYFTFTTKHHDGFCMFDAPNTDYDIEHTPFKRDIAKELADAAHKYGLKIFWYYSQPDWTHPDCLREGKHYESYLPYMNEQLTHLLTNYGKIDGIFFDGLGSKYWNWDIKTLIPMIKKLQPGILINPRYGFSLPDMSIRGDYDTPEQGVGSIDHNRYWESCITVTDKWLYNKNAPIKSYKNLISLLVQAVGNGGNLLLNFGPNGKGEFVKEEAEQGEMLGRWLKKYGETLYGTRRGTYISGDWGTSTQKGNKLYLHFLKRFANNEKIEFTLPSLPVEIISDKGITEGYLGHQVSKNGITFRFDTNQFDQNVDNIVELTLVSSPERMDRINTWDSKHLSLNDFSVNASSEQLPKHAAIGIFKDNRNVFSEGIHVKGWWSPIRGDKIPYIQIDLKNPKVIETVYLSEQIRAYTIQDFSIETQNKNGQWTEVYRGDFVGNGLRIHLSDKPVKSIRMNIYKASKGMQNVKISSFNIN